VIILDTNVVSEPLKPEVNVAVRTWLDRQTVDTLYLTATSLAELLAGIRTLPKGRRRDRLGADMEALVGNVLRARILPFDEDAARAYAGIAADARAAGRAISIADGQIAAIAKLHGFSVATRDTAPFLAAGVPVINPWEPIA
jgi:predicted nucleic acid-binding protein